MAAFGLLAGPTALTAQPVSTMGPFELCESQAVVQTFFNPFEYTIQKKVSWVERKDAGFLRESFALGIPSGRGASVVYQQGRVSLDSDMDELSGECSVKRIVVLTTEDDEQSTASVRGFDKSHRLTRAGRLHFGTFQPRLGSRGVSAPFDTEAGKIRTRLMNVGPSGAAFTVELADAITGVVVAAKTVYLDPGAGRQPNANAYTDFSFEHDTAGLLVVILTGPKADSQSTLAISVEAQPAQAGGSSPTETVSFNFDKITWKYWP